MSNMKKKVKTQISVMKRGAKLLPKFVAQKGKQYAERKFKEIQTEARRKAILNEQLKWETDQIRRKAYEEELKRQAKIEGQRIAQRKTAQGQPLGWRGQLQAAGQRMQVADLFGMNQMMGKKEQPKKKPKKK